MKTNHITDATKILLLAATTIFTCVIIWSGISALNTAREFSSSATVQMSELNNDIKDSGLKKYDGITVPGSEVVNCFKKQLGDYEDPEVAPIYIHVVTDNSDVTYQNNSHIVDIRDFTNICYIKPTATFLGKVIKNQNGIIVGVSFEQQ